MIDPIIKQYLNDNSIDQNKRKDVAQKLQNGEISPKDARGIIMQKYAGKYGGGVQGVGDKQPSLAASMGNIALKGAGQEQTAPQTTVPAPKMMVPNFNTGGFQSSFTELKSKSELTDQDKQNMAMQGLAVSRENPANIPSNIYSQAQAGIGTIQQGAGKIGEAINPAYPSTGEERLYKGASGAFDVIGGGLQTAFSPASGVIEAVPGVNKAVGWGMEKLNQGSQFAADKFKETLGIDPNSEQARVIDQGFNILGQLLAAKGGESLVKSKTVQGAVGKVGEMATPIIEKGKQMATTGLDVANQGLIKGGEMMSKTTPMVKDFISARKGQKMLKLQNEIKSDVNLFIENNKSFSRKANELYKSGTDIKKVISDPLVYNGLKVENGVVNPDLAIGTIQTKIDMLTDAKSQVLPEVSKYTPKITKEVYRTKAIESLSEEGMLPADLTTAIKRLDGQLKALPDSLSVEFLDKIRAKARKSARDAKGIQKPHNEYAAMENAARDLVFESTDKLTIDKTGEFAALNQQIKDLITTKTFLDKNIRGAKVKGGRIGKVTGRIIGSVAGTPGGVLGSILGSEIGAMVSDIVMNNQLGSSLKMRLIKNMVEDPALLNQIQSLVEQVKSYEPPLLEAPKTGFRTQVPSGEPINVPEGGFRSSGLDQPSLSNRQIDQSMPTNKILKNSIETNKAGTNTKPSTAGKSSVAKTAEKGYNTNMDKALIQEAKKYKTSEEFVNAQGNRFFHGTREGNKIDKFSLNKANLGVSSNDFSQGNRGIYLTDDLGSARYFSRKANEFNTLIDKVKDPLKKTDEAWQYLFGDKAKSSENVVDVFMDKDTRVKELAHYPRKVEVESIIKSGEYDAIRFPEKGMDVAADLPQDLWNEVKDSKTTFVFNINKIKTKSQLADIWNKAQSRPLEKVATPKSAIKRAKNLTPEYRAVESKAIQHIIDNEASILAAYKAKYGKVINTDNFRPLFKDQGYNGSNSAAVQEPSSYLTKKAYTEALNNNGQFVVGTGGGSGVGKTSALNQIPEYQEIKAHSAVILDSNMSSLETALKKIQEATNAGKEFVEFYTYRDPLDAFENGVIKRMKDNPEEMGRLVPTSVVAENHINSWNVARELEKKGVPVAYVDNSLGKGSAKLVTRAELESKIKYPSEEQLTEQLNSIVKKYYAKRKLTPAEYEGYTGKKASSIVNARR